jgi:hypothetical protein
MGWKDIKKQAIINEMDKMFPGQRKEIITSRYCLKCWSTYDMCECDKENVFID